MPRTGPAGAPRNGRLDGLLHYLAQLAGLDGIALARQGGGFNGEQFAAHFGPGQTGHLTHLIFLSAMPKV